jgi:hypothetical protein
VFVTTEIADAFGRRGFPNIFTPPAQSLTSMLPTRTTAIRCRSIRTQAVPPLLMQAIQRAHRRTGGLFWPLSLRELALA